MKTIIELFSPQTSDDWALEYFGKPLSVNTIHHSMFICKSRLDCITTTRNITTPLRLSTSEMARYREVKLPSGPHSYCFVFHAKRKRIINIVTRAKFKSQCLMIFCFFHSPGLVHTTLFQPKFKLMEFSPQVQIASAENEPATNRTIIVSVKAAKILWFHFLECEDLQTEYLSVLRLLVKYYTFNGKYLGI